MGCGPDAYYGVNNQEKQSSVIVFIACANRTASRSDEGLDLARKPQQAWRFREPCADHAPRRLNARSSVTNSSGMVTRFLRRWSLLALLAYYGLGVWYASIAQLPVVV